MKRNVHQFLVFEKNPQKMPAKKNAKGACQ
jgi:hypothetical protein